MWTGLSIIVVLLVLLAYLNTRPPPPVPVLTDTPVVPSPWSLGNDPNVAGGPPLYETGSWAGGRRPIRRPSTQAPEISMPLIRWAQRRFEAGNRAHTGDVTGPTDQSYWRAIDILSRVKRGGWFIVPDETGVDMYERYQPPFGQELPRPEANPAAVPVARGANPWRFTTARPSSTPATILMSEF